MSICSIIAGSNRDEVKLWLGNCRIFCRFRLFTIGSILNIPKVMLKDEDAFEAFNYYRSQHGRLEELINL